MTDDRKIVLQNFTKKLSNCRHNMPVAQLLEYLNEGKFGYTCPKDGETAIEINDFVFADDIYAVVNQIRAIVKEPHIFLKRESIIQNVSVAPNIDTEALIETYTDYKLWKVKEDAIEPEFVHAFVNEDNLAIYENRFISFLIDLLFQQVAKHLAILIEEIKTLNVMVGLKPLDGGFTTENYFEILADTNGEIPVVANAESAEVKTLNLLIKCKKQLRNLMESQFYISCKKASEFVPAGLKPTNILMMDKRYNYCYNFYINYTKNKDGNSSEAQSYVSFIVINFMNALHKQGFMLENPDAILNIAQSGRLTVSKVKFIKEPFAITLSKEDSSNVLLLDIELTADASKTRFAVNIVDTATIEKLENFTDVNEFAKQLNEQKDEKVERAFLITDFAPVKVGNAAFIVSDNGDATNKLNRVLIAMLIRAEVAIGIHSRLCPVCGSSLIAPEDSDLVCTTCECKYHLYSYGKKEYAWIKTLPRPVLENCAIYNDYTQEVAATAVEENAQEDVAQEPVVRISKSFTGKLMQSEDDVKDYYNQLKNYILSYKRVNSRVSWNYDSFNLGRDQMVKLAFKGKRLAIFLALDPNSLEEKYHAKDMGEIKKFENVPAMMKVKSERGVKYAKQLIDLVFDEVERKPNFEAEEYKFEYASDTELIEQGLAKYVTMGGSLGDIKPAQPAEKKASVVNNEQPVAQQSPEQPIVAEPAQVEVATAVDGDQTIIRINKSFMGKLMQADDEAKEYYNELRNYILSYKRVNGRVSWHYDSFNLGRDQMIKLAFKGKRLAVFLALDPASLDEKYHVKDMGEIKKFEEVPAMLKIKSERGLKYAKQLIDLVLDEAERDDDYVAEEFKYDYATDEQLVEQGLAKYTESKF